MDKRNRHTRSQPEDNTSSPFEKQLRWRWSRIRAFSLRDLWWWVLDLVETRKALRRVVIAAVALLVLAAATWFWGYPWWARRNAVSVTRQWMAVGQFGYAETTVKRALADNPANPELWRLAAEVARKHGSPADAVDYSARAAALAPGKAEYALGWAVDAMLAEQPAVAEKVLADLPAATVAASSQAQRILGEIARRRIELTAARDHFEAAARLDGPRAIDEVPLGAILIFSRDAAERARGLALLSKWTADAEWGAQALRTLLGDALDHDDRPAMLKWADALRAHPRCTLTDISNCLLGISRSDNRHFGEVLAILEKKYEGKAADVAQLLGWLNQIGRSAEALAWMRSMPPELTRKPPVVVLVAEAYRQVSDWAGLTTWVADGEWGSEVGFIRLTYGMLAARQLGNTDRANEFWRTLQSGVQSAGARALFAADTLYIWGYRDEALTLLWQTAEQPGVSVEALGTLARHYQTQRDAEGQYQVFRRLHSLRGSDASIANNFAFFASLTGHEAATALQTARENNTREPDNVAYRATYAFVLCQGGRASEAVTLLSPIAGEWTKSPGVAFAYGLALAGAGRKAEARPLLASLDLATLTTREEELVRAGLDPLQ